MEELEAVLVTGGAAAAELAASAVANRKCANCDAPMTGRFCSSCGQPLDTHRRSVHRLVKDLVKDIASFDSRILRTVGALMVRPGELAAAFREGRTQRYVPPVRLYLFVSLIFFLFLSVTDIAIFQFVMKATPEHYTAADIAEAAAEAKAEGEPLPSRYTDGKQHYTFNSDIVFFARHGSVHPDISPDARRAINEKLSSAKTKIKQNKEVGIVAKTVFDTVNKLAEDPAALNGALTAWIPRALFLLLPLFALLVAAFYWRQRKSLYFVDHLVFSLGFHSFVFAALLIAAALAQVLSAGAVLWTTLAAMGLYLLVAIRRFYGQSWAWTGAKFAAVSFLYVVCFVLPAFGVVISLAVMWG